MEEAEGRSPAFSRKLYLLAAASCFIFMGAGAQQAYLVPYLRRVTDWSQVACGAVIATVYFSMLVFRLVNIYLFPRWSDRRFTIVGALTYVFFTVAMFAVPYVESWSFAMVSAVLWGMGGAMMWTGTSMQTLDITDKAGGRHGTGMGILYSSTHLGWLIGAIGLGLIYDALSVETSQLLYAAAAGVTLVGNVLTCFIPATGPALRETPALSGLLEMMARPRALISGLLQFTSALGYGLVLGVFSKYIEDAYGSAWIGRAIWLYPAVRMVLSFFGGYFADRIGYTPVLVAGFLTSAVGLAVTIAWASPFAVLITVGTLALLSSTVPVVAAAIVGDAAGTSRRPLAYGIVFAWRDLGVGVAAIGANLLGLRLDFDAVFTVFICIFGGCSLLSVYLGKFAKEDM